MSKLLDLHPQEFINYLRDQQINRFFFVYNPESKTVIASHEQLKPIAEFIQNDGRDFMQHEGLFFQITQKYDTLQGAFVHRTCRGQGAGGVRYWQYSTMEDYLRDGLRLSKGMTRKNALAGLWWGGGKGVMAHNPEIDKNDPEIRASIYKEYGDLMTSIRGCYVTAEDVGTNVDDMTNIFSRTRFTTCIPGSLGGSGNPSIPTARGVICGMEAALEFNQEGALAGKIVAVQGMGNVGGTLIRYLFEKKVEKVIACDINPKIVERLKSELTRANLEAKIVKRGDNSILTADCDILAPCATGAILNPGTIPEIKARIVCGAANNQLEDSERDDQLLHEEGILYVPDFLTNRMGIVNCANEQYGFITEDPFFEKHLSREWEHSIHQTTLRVLKESRETGDPPAKVAIRIADELSLQPHPIFGHRGKQIIDSLIADRWCHG
ncbi:Glu/Leu/Phe/Val dehydrogenase [candidate division KSB1 bacterium]|nr:Glu/Leu/Phe/Val dehydrogenase [candidate division KSB1 bacterium]